MISPVIGLADRLVPGAAARFDFQLTRHLDAQTFEISGGGAEVTIRGRSNSSIASGLNWYLKHYCHAHMSWCGDQLAMPNVLPEVDGPLRVRSPYRWRYYFNYCTYSYSLAFWDWTRWEREIDWMALSGINLPLAVTGQEAVWQRVYRKLGFSDAELSKFFAGPAFLAWGWMGNLDGWGGPSPQSWIDGQAELQKKILARMRSFGMKPALPSFTGHVPPTFADHFPNASIKTMQKWAETFTGTHILEVSDPLFEEIGHRFMEEQRSLYGVDEVIAEHPDGDSDVHFFSCDTFNENSPPTGDPKWLDAAGQSIHRAMSGADEKAVWVLQDWMFYFNPTAPDFWKKPQIDALLNSVPDDRLLVLDLHSDAFPLGEKTGHFNGKPWVWCFLHNFGGHVSMYGNLARLATDPPAALADPNRGNLIGFGLTPEGIEQNPIMYDLATDMMWREHAPDVDAWVDGYVRRRYGNAVAPALAAWKTLSATAYSRPPDWGGTVATLINLPPRFGSDRMRLNYSPADLVPAWEQLQAAAADKTTAASEGFRYDLVNTARQVLSNFSSALINDAADACARGDAATLHDASRCVVELIEDLDTLLSTRPEFLLGRWIESAKAWGKTDDEKKLLEENARRQITLWGEETGMLRDYARKEWAGLLKSFYARRWGKFFAYVGDCMTRSVAIDDKAFQKDLRHWEGAWVRQRDLFADRPSGDAIAVSAKLLEKYRPQLAKHYVKKISLITDKHAIASAEPSDALPAGAAISGTADRTSYWSASTTPAWLSVDLREPTVVDAVQWFPYYGDGRAYRYSIEASVDGHSWQPLVDAVSNTAQATAAGHLHRFRPSTTRFLRLNLFGNTVNDAAHVLDFRAFGPSRPAPLATV